MYLLATLVGSLLLDSIVRPRPIRGRHGLGVALHLLVVTATFGLFLTLAGNAAVAAVLGCALMALFTVASNAKYKMLGEPLVFTDLALLAAVVRHPRFYFTAISVRQRVLMAFGAAAALVALISLISLEASPHVTGAVMLLAASGGLWLMLREGALGDAMRVPDLERDLLRFGLIATLVSYWRRWRDTADPPPCPPRAATAPAAPELIVIVQCESFVDPVEIGGDASLALPGLTRARVGAWQHGDLAVSGFGAYTMRTEYGVLFGRSEAELGFRRYGPFLTAHGETTLALPARLGAAGYRGIFVHPHDLGFYGRDRLMPAIGFDRVIGEDGFAPIPPGAGRYVDDRTLGAKLGDLAETAEAPTLLYAVTMENHGPWDAGRVPGSPGGLDAYLQHARSSDTMLSDLVERLAADGRPALLVFFGDHRPSIPGVSMPGGARHTPYVMMRFAAGGVPMRGPGRIDLTPDELHHAVLRSVL
ncbi:LTA synthase family protein [Sphingomonas sp. H39-1-10]|uniref:LTA synthase family protein n=1 Tax=Sphingomonas pollutisoli TaxID=3030829 RepID=UPI0023B8BE2A|nr:LTA synthase family protein [Sphingomonas pollutisoli]MDF0486693.1 LTA synthase family protein [Sphingomonas pollutisoli]